MVNFDDLAVGTWLTITGSNKRAFRLAAFNLAGTPFQLKAIDLPFLAVQFINTPTTNSIDVRNFCLKKVSEDYVKSLHLDLKYTSAWATNFQNSWPNQSINNNNLTQ